MRKLFNQLLTFAVLGSVVLLTSCGDDDTDVIAPALSVEIGGTDIDQATFDVGETVDLTVTFVSEAELAGLSYAVTVDGTTGSTTTIPFGDIGLGTAETAGTFNFTFPVNETLSGSSVILSVTAEDKTGKTATDDFSFDVTSSPQARSYSAILLNAPTADKTNTAFFSSSDGEVYSPAQVTGTADAISPKIDFGYYYGQTNQASLASPADFVNTAFAAQVEGWSTLNNVSFRSTTLTATEFLELSTYADIDAAYDNGTDEGGIVTNLTIGDVVAFETDADKTGGSKRGLVLVKDISGTVNSNDYIELDVLVQEPAN